MARAFPGVGEPEAVINVGVSGPGIVHHAVRHAARDLPLQDLAETIKTLLQTGAGGELVDAKQHVVWAFLSASSIFHWRRHRCQAIR